MGIEEVMKYVVEKLKEALLWLENFAGEAVSWFDGVFPPETRTDKITHWFHLAQPYLAAAVVLTVVVCFCRCCCNCCCRRGRGGGGGGGMVKMMKAPGRNVRMARGVFESNPRGYFRTLRANPGDHLC
ncbi:hypothetical protein ABFS82_12G089700 [Erythranthe guttata]